MFALEAVFYPSSSYFLDLGLDRIVGKYLTIGTVWYRTEEEITNVSVFVPSLHAMDGIGCISSTT